MCCAIKCFFFIPLKILPHKMLLTVYRKSFKISGPSVTKKHLIARDVPKQSISKCSKKSDHLKILIRGPTQKKHYSNAPIVRRTFSQAHNLKKLERAHTGEKLFKCPKCANRNLKEHEDPTRKKSHSGAPRTSQHQFSWKPKRGSTQERFHSSAQSVTGASQHQVTWRHTRPYRREAIQVHREW